MASRHSKTAYHHRSARFRALSHASAEFYRQLALTLRAGEELPLEDLMQHLESIGYEKREPVEMEGEFSSARRHSGRVSRRSAETRTNRVFRR